MSYHSQGEYTVGFPWRPGDSWIKGQTPPPEGTEWAAPRPTIPRAAGQELAGIGDTVVHAARLAAAGAMAYHGYKRTQSGGWAAAWGLFGATLPILAVPISVAQGFGKRKGRK